MCHPNGFEARVTPSSYPHSLLQHALGMTPPLSPLGLDLFNELCPDHLPLWQQFRVVSVMPSEVTEASGADKNRFLRALAHQKSSTMLGCKLPIRYLFGPASWRSKLKSFSCEELGTYYRNVLSGGQWVSYPKHVTNGMVISVEIGMGKQNAIFLYCRPSWHCRVDASSNRFSWAASSSGFS